MDQQDQPDEPNDYFPSIREAAAYAQITQHAFYMAFKQGRLKGVKRGKRWYVSKKALDEYRLNKFNRDLRKFNGELLFDMSKGCFAVAHVSKIISSAIGKEFNMQHLYYLIRSGQLRAFKKGSVWVVKREDAIELLEKQQGNAKFMQKQVRRA